MIGYYGYFNTVLKLYIKQCVNNLETHNNNTQVKYQN